MSAIVTTLTLPEAIPAGSEIRTWWSDDVDHALIIVSDTARMEGERDCYRTSAGTFLLGDWNDDQEEFVADDEVGDHVLVIRPGEDLFVLPREVCADADPLEDTGE